MCNAKAPCMEHQALGISGAAAIEAVPQNGVPQELHMDP